MCRLKALNVFDERYIYFTTSAAYTRDLQRPWNRSLGPQDFSFLFKKRKNPVAFLSRNARVTLFWDSAFV